MFTIAAAGYWTVGSDITTTSGKIVSEKTGLLTIPTSGWKYADSGFHKDDNLKFLY